MGVAPDCELSGRLDRLERENRIWKGAGACALLGLSAVLLMAQSGPSRSAILDTKLIVLRDDAGQPRVVIGPGNVLSQLKPDTTGTGGEFGLYVYGSDGALRTSL